MAERARRRILAVGAHPDDVEIGAGATLLAHRAAGDELVVVTMSAGGRGGDAAVRAAESRAAADLLGARLYLSDQPDTAIAAAEFVETFPVPFVRDVIRPQEIAPGFGR